MSVAQTMREEKVRAVRNPVSVASGEPSSGPQTSQIAVSGEYLVLEKRAHVLRNLVSVALWERVDSPLASSKRGSVLL